MSLLCLVVIYLLVELLVRRKSRNRLETFISRTACLFGIVYFGTSVLCLPL